MLAARITDMHVCPMVTPGVPPIPHVGGPIVKPATVRVLIGNLPPAGAGSICVCVGPPDSIIAVGSILVGGIPLAKMGDSTVHGGVIVGGCPTVILNMGGVAGAASAAAGAAAEAAAAGAAVAAEATAAMNDLKEEQQALQDKLDDPNADLSDDEQERLDKINSTI